MAGVANRIQDIVEEEVAAETGAAIRQTDEAFTLEEILAPGVNLAELMTEEERARIGSRVIEDVEIDERSRGKGSGDNGANGDWLARYRKWLDMAMQIRESKSFPWAGASNVKFPLLTTAAIQFQARAYPAIVDGSNLVKGRVLGPDPDGKKRERADRIGQHMTYQLLYRMPGWEEETDKLLLMLPITGCVFRKTYYDSIANANVSEMVSGEDFIANYWTKSLDSAPRFTHVLRYYPHEVLEKVQAGLWLTVRAEADDSDAADESAIVEFYEQHRTMDLDGDGYPEPYVVTTTKEGDVARIVPCFGPDEITILNLETQQPDKLSKVIDEQDPNSWGRAGGVVRIERRQYFTKYGFIPAPDGSFYDIGFGALLEDLLEPINTAINQTLDAASLQNAQGGFVGSGVNIKGGNMIFRLGEWKRVDTTGGNLRDNIFPLNLPGPSPVLMNLINFLVASAREITSTQDILSGGPQPATKPATTTLAEIEQATKTMTAIFKRVWRSFGQELRILRRLNRDYLDEEEYFQLNDNAPEPDENGQMQDNAVRIGREDYQDADLDVVPVADPTTSSDMQKMARAQALLQFNGDPLVNQQEIRRRYFEAIGEGDLTTLLKVPEPAPDPKVLLEGMKEQRARIETDAKVRGQDATAALNAMKAAETAFGLGLYLDAASLSAAAARLGGSVDDNIEAGGVPSVEGQPGNAGVPGPAPGPPAGIDGGMGPGNVPGAGDPGAGGGVGPVGADQI